MATSQIWIHYHPRLYQELFTSVLNGLEQVCVVEMGCAMEAGNGGGVARRADVIIFSLTEEGFPDLHALVDPPPEAKLLAFSPTGELGWRRMPGERHWEKVCPFQMEHLLNEISNGTSKPVQEIQG